MAQLTLGLALLIQGAQLAPILEASGPVDKPRLEMKVDGVRGGLWQLEDKVP